MLNSSRSSQDVPFALLLIFGAFIAPVIEEFIFRGIFAKSKVLKSIALVVLPVSVFFYTRGNYNFMVVGLLILMALGNLLLYKNIDRTPRYLLPLLIISNAAIFSLIHYQASDFTSMGTAVFALSQFAFALVCIWITLNYNLVKAILVHTIYNTVLFSIFFLGYQFVDDSVVHIGGEALKVDYEKVPILNTLPSQVTRDSALVEIKDMNLVDAVTYLYIPDSLKSGIKISDTYQRYNITISSKSKILSDRDIAWVINKIAADNQQ